MRLGHHLYTDGVVCSDRHETKMAILCMLFLILVIFPHGLQSSNQHSLHIQEAGKTGEITVKYTVIHDLLCTSSCSHSLPLTVPEGDTLLQIMESAQKEKPAYFGFTKTETSLGTFITSIGGINGSTKNRTYWQFLNGAVPIIVGVAQYKPSNGEHVIARFSKY
ncbi:cobalamin binding intrinsic factor-like [Mustelus asterias]